MIYSKYLRNKLVDFLFRGGSYTPPATMYAALLVSEPTVNDVVQEIGNVSANGYARVAITSNATNWAATNGAGTTTNPSTGTLGETSNNTVITFPNPSGGFWAYGSPTGPSVVKYIALFDASTSGNLLMYAPVANKTFGASDYNPNVPIGAVTFVLDE